MKKSLSLLIFLLVMINLQAQDFAEVNPPVFSDSFLSIRDTLNSDDWTAEKKLQYLDGHLDEIEQDYAYYYLSFWYYTFLNQETGDYEAILEKLSEAQSKGFFFPLMTGNRTWPAYVENISELPDFDAFIQKNDELREVAAEKSKAEYFVVLPENYDPDRTYPLLAVLHGGTGSHYQSRLFWQSEELSKNHITAYLQGAEVRGSYARRFDNRSLDDVLGMLEGIINEYPVDTSRILIGGPSAGGYRSILLGLRQELPVAGLLLLFPVVPRGIENEALAKASAHKLKVALITGELDTGLPGQKELAYRMDTSQIKNRFIINSGKGHEYPDDLSEQIDLSLKFLEKEKGKGEQLMQDPPPPPDRK